MVNENLLEVTFPKNIYFTQDRKLERKIAEILLAPTVEQKFSKDKIMEFYCNTNNYGNGCYGIESASQYYFGKSAADVSVSEAAMIVGISNSPSRNNPVANYDLAIQKRNSVLKKMYDNGVISKKEYIKISLVKNLVIFKATTTS